MTKSKLVEAVAQEAYLTKKAARDAVNAVFNEIIRSLEKGQKVTINGFGTFYINNLKSKEVVPFGDESMRITVEAHKTVNFKVGKPLKRSVW